MSECVGEEEVCGFASDAGELDEGVEGAREFSVVVLEEGGAEGADAFGFVSEEAGGLDEGFEFGGLGVGVVVGGAIFFEERRGDGVDAFVGALRGEDGGDGEFEGGGEVEFAAQFDVAAQAVEDFGGAVAQLGGVVWGSHDFFPVGDFSAVARFA